MPNSINKAGVNIFPILSIISVGFIVKNRTILKYITVNIIGFVLGKSGITPISYAVAPVLGKANKGPIAKTIVIPKNFENNGDTLFPNLSILPPTLADAIIPKNGNPIPVKKNPTMDQFHLSPDINPKNGGKIKFPAPKNIENNTKPNI